VGEIVVAKDAEAFAEAGEALGLGTRQELMEDYAGGSAVAVSQAGRGGLEGEITILLSNFDPLYVDHEMGHVIWQGLSGSRRATYERFWNSPQDWGKPTAYARTSASESFAEVYAAWIGGGYEKPSRSLSRDLFRNITRPMDFVEEGVRGL
jgi:hypothetical protein